MRKERDVSQTVDNVYQLSRHEWTSGTEDLYSMHS